MFNQLLDWATLLTLVGVKRIQIKHFTGLSQE